MKGKGIGWKDVNPPEILGIDYSSASGYAKITSQVIAPSSSQSAGGCKVDAGERASASQRQQGGCGI
jgi:hypothetical protein